jgi:hypothetical protein
LNMRKTAGIFLCMFLVSALLSVFVGAINITTQQTFDNLTTGANITAADNTALQLSIYPKSNSITVAEFPSATDKSLKFVKSGTDDPYINSSFPSPVTGVIVMDLKLYIEELNTSANIMFREPTPTFFNVVTFNHDGKIISNAKNLAEGEEDNVIGTWRPNEWIKVVAKVNPSTKKYSVYINEKLVVNNADIGFENYNSVGLTRFAIGGDNDKASGPAVIYVNDIRTYTESEEIMTDEYFGVPAFVPPVTKPDPKADAPKTSDPVTLALASLALPVSVFALKRKKRASL